VHTEILIDLIYYERSLLCCAISLGFVYQLTASQCLRGQLTEQMFVVTAEMTGMAEAAVNRDLLDQHLVQPVRLRQR
jgi:hypothetical protein